MPTIFRTNNPTRISLIDKSAIALRLSGVGTARTFFIERFERSAVVAPGSASVACLAKAGQTFQYFDLGSLDQICLSSQRLSELAPDSTVQFRLMVYDAETGRILAAAENVRCVDEDGLAPSLLCIDPISLGGPIWRLELADVNSDIQPVLAVEKDLFPFARAASSNAIFLAYVLPEVVRQIATKIVDAELDDDTDGSWVCSWQRFFCSMGVAKRDETEVGDDARWIDDCVIAFCKRGQMGPVLQNVIFPTEEPGK